MNKSIILLSGGLDSVVSLAAAKDEYNVKLALTFDYGQRAKDKEISAAKAIADYYGIEHKVVSIPWLAAITKTSLVNQSENLPQLGIDKLDNAQLTNDSAKKVWVPNRNGLFINIAAAFADSAEYSHILFGANKEEATTFPDNSEEFVEKINFSLAFSTLVKAKVYAPLAKFTKKEIINIAIEKKVPLILIRSCYTSEDKHCGKCESCLRLKRALIESGNSKICEELF